MEMYRPKYSFTTAKMAEFDAFDGDIDAWPTEWDPDREDTRFIPPGATLPAFIALPTHTEAVQEANRQLKNSGFGISINKPAYTKPSKAKPTKTVRGATLRCACSRPYTPTGGQRFTTSRMSGCTWAARMKWVEGEGDEGASGWQFTVEDPRHNHPESGEQGLPQFRKREKPVLERIKSGKSNGDSAMRILRNLRGTGDNVRLKDVSNELAKLRQEELGGRTRIQALVEFLRDYSFDDSGDTGSKFYQEITQDEEGRASIVFFSHPRSFKITKCNPDVVQIDATYKTNAFNMPLVHIVGITGMGRTFDIAYAFVPNELSETYLAVVQMLQGLFEKL